MIIYRRKIATRILGEEEENGIFFVHRAENLIPEIIFFGQYVPTTNPTVG